MSVYMISYDLNSPGQNYAKVRESIESLGDWCHFLESTYLVNTTHSGDIVQKVASEHLDGNDRIMISLVVPPIRGRLSQEEWDWIRLHI